MLSPTLKFGTIALCSLLVAACNRHQPAENQTLLDVNMTDYSSSEPSGDDASGHDETGGDVTMNSWDFDGSASAAPPDRGQNLAPTRVDIEDLHSAYRSNAVAALDRYGSGPFLVTGQVKGVGEELGKMMIHFHTNDDAVLADMTGAGKIEPYQTITVLCGAVKSYGSFLELQDCAVQGT